LGEEEKEGRQNFESTCSMSRLLEQSDWDVMMSRRKEAMARARRRRKKDGDLTVNDDHIMALIRQMREAAQEDRKLNIARKAATKKIQLLPAVMGHLRK
jgi:transcription factor SPN1